MRCEAHVMQHVRVKIFDPGLSEDEARGVLPYQASLRCRPFREMDDSPTITAPVLQLFHCDSKICPVLHPLVLKLSNSLRN